MAISDKTRKLLWGHSGNRCAICRNELVINSTLNSDKSVIGEECHICASHSNGPRYDKSLPSEKIDNYDNLILLCGNHHKMVDDQYETYTVDLLKQIKANHEKWIIEKLDEKKEEPKPLSIKQVKENVPNYLTRITNGKEFFSLIENTYGFYYDYDEIETEEQQRIISYFLQMVEDFLDILDDFQISDRMKATISIDKEIKDIEKEGYYIFGARETQLLESGISNPENWPIFHIRIIKQTNPIIIKPNSK